jgi:hypothetical protein
MLLADIIGCLETANKAPLQPMSTTDLSTHQKALEINLDGNIYGTIAEIGAAQEVARWFFRVGAAAGSIAKTMSAYDMRVSDEIYGKTGRYVSRERVEAMLDKEYSLLIERLSESRGADTRFFAFCNSVAARNFTGTNECHGWVGLRFQTEPLGASNTIILHINMLDETAIAQQEAVGVLGVNLIHSAFSATEGPVKGLDRLPDNLNEDQLEIDVADLWGPAFDDVDTAKTGMAMIRSGLAQAILFNRNVFAAAERQLQKEVPDLNDPPLKVTEFSMSSVHATMGSDAGKNLAHLRELIAQDEWVMLTRLRQSYKLTDYLRRYSRFPLRFVMGASTFAMLMSEKFYVDSPGGILEATGRLYADTVRVYVQPMPVADFRAHLEAVGLASDWVKVTGENEEATLNNLEFSGPTRLLHRYLIESGWVTDLATD